MLMGRLSLPLLLFPCLGTLATSAFRGAKLQKQRQRSVQNTFSITGFVLINADTNEEIGAIDNGSIVNLSSLPTTSLNIEAVTEGSDIDSVSFDFNENTNFRTEKVAPYALCGDSGGNFASCWMLDVGFFTITASAKSGNDIVSTKTTTFTIVSSSPPTPPPTLAPATDEPTRAPTGPPSTVQPSQSPATDDPTTAPTTAQPSQQPSTAAPTLAPSTVQPMQSPTTAVPSSAAPTSTQPTQTPTTLVPSTVQPTPISPPPTVSPTTQSPTVTPTTAPTTAVPSSAAPTSAQPTQIPTTLAPLAVQPAPISPSPTVSPTTQSPTMTPTSAQPTQQPSTGVPTLAPSTNQPMQSPTTAVPSSAAPTSAQPTQTPTTLAPSTVQPTRISPAPTVSPATQSPTMTPTENNNFLTWVESFDGLANGSTSDVGDTAWVVARDNGDFNVQNGELVVTNGGDEGVFQTNPIDIAGLSVDISVQVYSTGPLEDNQDYVRVYAIVDGGAEQLLGEVKGVQSAAETITGAGLTGSTVVIVIRAYVSYFDEFYHMDDLRVDSTGSAPTGIATPAPTSTPSTVQPTDAPAGSSTLTDPPTLTPTDSAECQPLEDTYQYVIGQDFFQATEIVNTSCESSVLVSMQLANTGDMETAGSSVDYMKVFLQVDSEDEVLWLDILGNVEDPAPQELVIFAGSQLTIRIEGETSCDCEVYQISDFKVRPATTVVSTSSPTTTPTIENTVMATAGTPAPSTTTGSIAVISGELQKWHKITLTYNGPAASETDVLNPFLNYRMDITFSNGGLVYTVPGYFAADGDAANTGAASGNKWVCHFAPDATGVWQYSTSFVAGVDVAIAPGGTPTSFNGDSGSFVVSESTKTGVDHRGKGRLEYVGEHHLKFADSGTYFLKCGADSPENFLAYGEFDGTSNQKDWGPHVGDWMLGDPTWDSGTRGKGIIGALNYLSSKGMNAFSFLTMNIQGDDGNVFPYIGEDENSGDFLRMDVSKLAQWEIVFEHADKMGLFMHFKTQETENDQLLDGGALGTERKLYYRELVARFSHHLALNWNLGEEITNSISEIKEFSDYFKALDPYQHIVILHTGLGGYESYYGPMLGYPTFDGASLQLDLDDVFSETLEWVERSSSSNPLRKWIVTNDEQAPSSDGAMPDNVSPAINNQDMIRIKVLWGNIMAGGAGVEYYFGYGFDCTDLNCQDLATRDNMWTVSNHALTFFQSYVPFWNMSNENAARVPSGSSDWVLSNGSVLVVYINDADSSSGTIDMTGLAGQYVVQWYDPRSGGALLTGSVLQIDGGAVVSYGSPPASIDEDWAILLQQL